MDVAQNCASFTHPKLLFAMFDVCFMPGLLDLLYSMVRAVRCICLFYVCSVYLQLHQCML